MASSSHQQPSTSSKYVLDMSVSNPLMPDNNDVSNLQQTFASSCKTAADLWEDTQAQAKLSGLESKLKANVDSESLGKLTGNLAEINSNLNIKITGSLSELWTFLDNSNINISVRLPYGGPFGIVPTNSPGLLEVVGFGKKHKFFQTSAQRFLFVSFLLTIFIYFLFLFVIFPVSFMPMIKTVLQQNLSCFNVSQQEMKNDEAMSLARFVCYFLCLMIIFVPLAALILSGVLKASYKVNIIRKFKFLKFCNFLVNKWKQSPAFTKEQIQFPLTSGQSVNKVVHWSVLVEVPDEQLLNMTSWRKRQADRFGEESLTVYDRCRPYLQMVNDRFWRWNLTDFESELIRSLTEKKLLVLGFLKFLVKSSLSVKSFHIKTAFCWTRFFMSDDEWLNDDVCLLTLKVFSFLKSSSRSCFLPNWFHFSENLVCLGCPHMSMSAGEMLNVILDRQEEFSSLVLPSPSSSLLEFWAVSTKSQTAQLLKFSDFSTCYRQYRHDVFRLNSFFIFLASLPVFLALLLILTFMWISMTVNPVSDTQAFISYSVLGLSLGWPFLLSLLSCLYSLSMALCCCQYCY